MRAATKMGVEPRFVSFDDAPHYMTRASAVVSTVPADAGAGLAQVLAATLTAAGERVESGAVLLDAVYSPLDTPLGLAWEQAGGTFVRGTRMLLHQAGEQVRLMTGREAPLTSMSEALDRAIESRHSSR